MNQWVKVVSLPLGLAAFALYLVFGLLKPKRQRPKWVMPLACGLAAVALLGGLSLQFFGNFQPTAKPANRVVQQPPVRQETKGNQSPAVVSQGDVNITYDKQSAKKNPRGSKP